VVGVQGLALRRAHPGGKQEPVSTQHVTAEIPDGCEDDTKMGKIQMSHRFPLLNFKVKNSFAANQSNEYNRRLPCPRSILVTLSAFHHHVQSALRVVDQFRPRTDSILRGLLLLRGPLRRLSGIELCNNLRIDTVQELLGEDAKQRPRQVE
jgi:hypothetical protein